MKTSLKDSFISVFVKGENNAVAQIKMAAVIGIPALVLVIVDCIVRHLS